jgi:hypothetical protein
VTLNDKESKEGEQEPLSATSAWCSRKGSEVVEVVDDNELALAAKIKEFIGKKFCTRAASLSMIS